MWGFNRLRKRTNYRKKKKEDLALQKISMLHMNPLQRGIKVYSLVKWISCSFGYNPLYYDSVLTKTISQRGLPLAVQLHEIYSRERDHYIGNIFLPYDNIPLFLHGVGLYDAYQLARIFLAWKSRTYLIQYRIAIGKRNRLHETFILWKSQTQYYQYLRSVALLVLQKNNTSIKKAFLQQWRIVNKLSRFLAHKRKSNQKNAFYIWYTTLKKKFQRNETDQTFTAYHHLATYKRVLARTQDHTRHAQYHRQLYKLGMKYHRHKMLQKGFYFLLQHKYHVCNKANKRLLHSMPRYSYKLSTKHKSENNHNNASMVTMSMNANHHGLSNVITNHFKQKHLFDRLRTHGLWRRGCRLKGRQVRLRSELRLVYSSFGGWWVLTLKHAMACQRYQMVRKRYLSKLSKSTFLHWFRLKQQRSEYRYLVQQEKYNRQLELNHRLIIALDLFTNNRKRNVIKYWKYYMHICRIQPKMDIFLKKFYGRQTVFMYFTRWIVKVSHILIVLCLQKIWRGYYSRRNTAYKAYQYMKWIRVNQCVKKFVTFRNTHIKLRAFKLWSTYHENSKRTRLQQFADRQMIRCVQKLYITGRSKSYSRKLLSDAFRYFHDQLTLKCMYVFKWRYVNLCQKNQMADAFFARKYGLQFMKAIKQMKSIYYQLNLRLFKYLWYARGKWKVRLSHEDESRSWFDHSHMNTYELRNKYHMFNTIAFAVMNRVERCRKHVRGEVSMTVAHKPPTSHTRYAYSTFDSRVTTLSNHNIFSPSSFWSPLNSKSRQLSPHDERLVIDTTADCNDTEDRQSTYSNGLSDQKSFRISEATKNKCFAYIILIQRVISSWRRYKRRYVKNTSMSRFTVLRQNKIGSSVIAVNTVDGICGRYFQKLKAFVSHKAHLVQKLSYSSKFRYQSYHRSVAHFAHDYYECKVLHGAVQRWYSSSKMLSKSRKSQTRLLSVIERRYSHKLRGRAFVRLYTLVHRKHRLDGICIRMNCTNVMNLWKHVYFQKRFYYKQIFKMRCKSMSKLVKNVFLLWKLYTVKRMRVAYIGRKISLQKTIALKKNYFHHWTYEIDKKSLHRIYQIVHQRYAHNRKLAVFKWWIKRSAISRLKAWRKVYLIFHEWAKLTTDNKIINSSMHVGEMSHAIRQARKYIGRWREVTSLHLMLNEWNYSLRHAMLVWKCKKYLNYWRVKCRWLGRRVRTGARNSSSWLSSTRKLRNANTHSLYSNEYLHNFDTSFEGISNSFGVHTQSTHAFDPYKTHSSLHDILVSPHARSQVNFTKDNMQLSNYHSKNLSTSFSRETTLPSQKYLLKDTIAYAKSVTFATWGSRVGAGYMAMRGGLVASAAELLALRAMRTWNW